MQVKDIMTRDVEIARRDTSLSDAAEKMRGHDIGMLPICDGNEACTLWPPAGVKTFPPSEQYRSDVFTVTATATYGDVRRSVEAVVDRKDPGTPVLYSWRVR